MGRSVGIYASLHGVLGHMTASLNAFSLLSTINHGVHSFRIHFFIYSVPIFLQVVNLETRIIYS